jgi:plasmid replication initiation protein
MAKNGLVVKSNQVIEASYSLSTIEQRLILTAISLIPKAQKITDEEIYTVSVTDLQAMGANETTAYRDLKDGLNRLYERSIHLKSGNEKIKMRWVQSVKFIDDTRVVGIRFSKEILPFISNLKNQFTKYALSDISEMTSSYAIRIYEMLIQYKSIGQREISVSDLRNMLELNKKYPLFADFKKRVIDISVDQINKKSPLLASYTITKTGRKMTHFIFRFKEKETLNKTKKPSKLKDPKIFGVPKSEIEKKARAGESYEQAAARIKAKLKNKKSSKERASSEIESMKKILETA